MASKVDILPSKDFSPVPNRAACAVLVGYKYQADLTILRWIHLRKDQALELECGEDIDTLGAAVSHGPEESLRRLEQVKVLSHRITLRSPAAVAFLAHSVFHTRSNPDLHLGFLFTTTTQVGKERPSFFPNSIPALHAWQDLREGQLDARQAAEILNGIRATLQSQSKPLHVSDDIWETYTDFINTATDADFVDLVRCTEWSTACTIPLELPEEIQTALIELNYSQTAVHAREMYNRLFVHVFRVLTGTSPRRLRCEEIEQYIALPTLSAADKLVLDLVRGAKVHQIGRRLSYVEDTMSSFRSDMRQLVSAHPELQIRGVPRADSGTWTTTPPPRVDTAVERRLAVDSLQRQLEKSRWLNLRGSSGTGKSQLMIELCVCLELDLRWVSLRDLELREAQAIIGSLTSTLGSATAAPTRVTEGGSAMLVVLDDLPIPGETESFDAALIDLATVAREQGFLLTSSCQAIPHKIVERLPSNLLCDLEVPRFRPEEAEQLFCEYGASEDFLAKADILFLVKATRGHPVLLVAIAKVLAKRDWQLGEEGMAGVLTELEVGELVDEVGLRILDELEDKVTRDLLYRLSLVSGEFTDTQVTVVAGKVNPPIDRARERLIRVTGPWIERHPASKLSVSPLITPLAKAVLPLERQASIYRALARDILSRPIRSVFDALNAVSYFFKADLADQGYWVLGRTIDAAIGVDTNSLRLLMDIAKGPAVREIHVSLPAEAYLLGQRFRAYEAVGEPVAQLAPEVNSLLSRVGDDDGWAIPMLAINSLPGIAKADLNIATQLVEKAMEHLEELCSLLPEEHKLDVADLGGVLLWGVSIGANSPAALRNWLELLARCPDEVREATLGLPGAEMGLSGLMDSIVDQVSGDRSSVQELEEVLVYAESLSEETDLGILKGCAARSLFILRSKVKGEFSEAIAEASKLVKGSAMIPSAEYAVRDVVGRFLLDNGEIEQGNSWLAEATELSTDAFPFLRWSALIRQAASLYELHQSIELPLLESALSVARRNPEFCAPYSETRALGELGIASWLAMDFQAAFSYFKEAVGNLIRSQSDEVRWKATFALLGHALGFIASDVGLRSPPEALLTGERHVAPKIGFFLNDREELADAFRIDRMPAVLAVVSIFAAGIGDIDSAGIWALEALERAREAGVLEVIATSARHSLPSLLKGNAVREAVDVALECALAIEARMALDHLGYPPLEPVQDLPEVLSSLPSDKRADAELRAIDDGVLLAFLRVARLQILEEPDAIRITEDLIKTCDEIGETASNQEVWGMASQMIHSAVLEQGRAEDLLEQGHQAEDKGFTALTALSYFGLALAPNADLKETAIAQTLAAFYVHQQTQNDMSLFSVSVLDFLEVFWSRAMANQRFRFKTPALAKKKFAEVMALDVGRRAQGILGAALTFLGKKLPDGADNQRQWLESAWKE